MTPMSEFDLTAVSEGYLATTIDRKERKDQCTSEETSFLNGRLLLYMHKYMLINAQNNVTVITSKSTTFNHYFGYLLKSCVYMCMQGRSEH